MDHEPEIDALGRAAQLALRVLRWLFALLGLLAIAGAVFTVCYPVPVYSDDVPPLPTLVAHQTAFVCLGLPLVLPVGFTLGRGWRHALALGAALWFLPMLLPGDPVYGFGVRMFATLVAIAVLAVWRTLIGLTNPTKAAARPWPGA
ncbi:MAG: hypothetical protein KDE27_22095 [Planctomycetes bacterium]|nr:hypothetical protein [Planctomycetota bacterium]